MEGAQSDTSPISPRQTDTKINARGNHFPDNYQFVLILLNCIAFLQRMFLKHESKYLVYASDLHDDRIILVLVAWSPFSLQRGAAF